jgi:hypothetical protein
MVSIKIQNSKKMYDTKIQCKHKSYIKLRWIKYFNVKKLDNKKIEKIKSHLYNIPQTISSSTHTMLAPQELTTT